jgi:hypothetical protein
MQLVDVVTEWFPDNLEKGNKITFRGELITIQRVKNSGAFWYLKSSYIKGDLFIEQYYISEPCRISKNRTRWTL